METGSERGKGELTENGRKFWETFIEVLSKIDPSWVKRMEEEGSKAVFFILGSGASDAETSALTQKFPKALRFAVDINPDSGPLVEFYGFSFIEASADDSRIYQGRKPDLVIIRNPSPGDKEMWKEAIELAWSNMADGGILYLSSSHFDKSIVSEMISFALGIDKDVVEGKWLQNKNLLSGAFPDNFVICFQKPSLS